jgi:hypothetical protein
MTTTRAITLMSVATLPLLALTARAFFVSPKGELTTTDLATYADGSKELDEARRLIAAASGGAPREPRDPAGWRSLRAAEPAEERIEYRVVAALDKAGQALTARGDSATGDVASAIGEVQGLLTERRRAEVEALEPSGSTLVASLGEALGWLQRRQVWLVNRAETGATILSMTEALAGEPKGTGEAKCLQLARSVATRLPRVVPPDVGDDPPDARTTAEDEEIRRLAERAVFRSAFHSAMGADSPRETFERLSALLDEYSTAPDPADGPLRDAAAAALPAARLAHYEAEARSATDARDFVVALRRWLDTPGDPRAAAAGERTTKGAALTREWLGERVPALKPPDRLAPLIELQEARWQTGGATVRLLGVFQAIPNDARRWRYWQDNDQKMLKDAGGERKFPRGWHTVTLDVPPDPAPSAVLGVLAEYQKARDEFLLAATKSRGDDLVRQGHSFSELCDTLAGQLESHLSIPADGGSLEHPLQKAHDEWGKSVADSLRAAGRIAVDFAALDSLGSASPER